MDYAKIYESVNEFTFKQGKKTRGKAGIGEATPSIKIKYKGKECGSIEFNDSFMNRGSSFISIRLMYKDSEEDKQRSDYNAHCNWHWTTLKKKDFNGEEEAKQFLQDNIDYLLPKLRFSED
jgi:hypothetical protein